MRSGNLSREAEHGGLPLFASVPFTDEVLQAGVHTALATHLFKSGEITSARAAKLAGMGLPQFLAYLSAQGVAVVDHDPAELAQELANFDARP